MKEVRIAELKARLSEYLRAVRAGETVAVFDRDTPVARIEPVRASPALRVRAPEADAPRPGRILALEPAGLDLDVVDLLLEERQGRR